MRLASCGGTQSTKESKAPDIHKRHHRARQAEPNHGRNEGSAIRSGRCSKNNRYYFLIILAKSVRYDILFYPRMKNYQRNISTPSLLASIVSLAIFILLTFACAGLGAMASISAGTMYGNIIKPSWAPPANLFGPVWTCLYAMMALAGWLVWREHKRMKVSAGLKVYAVHLVFNVLWSWMFFGLGRADLAMLDIVFLWGLILWMMCFFWRVNAFAGLLMLPYLLWVSFASVLNGSLWFLNGGVLPR